MATIDIHTWSRLRTQVAFIPFDFALLSAASSLQNVLLAPRYHGLGDPATLADEASELLQRLAPGLDMHCLPAALRRDEQYKVALARALILKPAVLMLDSPFSFFDHREKARMQDFLLEQQAGGLAIVQVTHDLPFVFAHAERILFPTRTGVHTFDSKQAIIDSSDAEIRQYLACLKH